jgi:transmembrane protein EpsG
MNVYVFIPLWIGLMSFIASNNQNLTKKKLVQGTEINQTNIIFAIITFLPIFLTVSMGDKLGDVWAYISNFKQLSTSFSDIDYSAKGPGFTVIEVIIKRIFGNSETAFRVIIALIQSIPIVLIFRYYSSEYVTSMFLFVATASYTGWMMNGLRQFTAAAIIFAATPLLMKKKYISLIIVILCASTIHNTALIMLPVIFIVQGKAWNKRTVLFILAAIVAMYVFGNYTNVFDSAIDSVGLDYSISAANESGDTGTSFLRVLVNSIPALIALIYRKKIDENNLIINVLVNMSVITAGLYLISMVTSGILIGRLPGYTTLYNMILLPYLVKNVFDEHDSKLVNIAMIILYSIYYFYQMHFVNNLF